MSESTTLKNCHSCMRAVQTGMEFCIYCGVGLTVSAEQKRTQSPIVFRTCSNCGQSDKLNAKYCLFCSGPIFVPGQSPSDSPALKSFTKDLEKMRVAEIEQLAQAAVHTSEAQKQKSVGLSGQPMSKLLKTTLSVVAGLLIGAGLAFAVGSDQFNKVWLQYSLPPESVVVYTEHPGASVVIEILGTGSLKALTTSDKGTLCLRKLEPNKHYRMRISSPGHKSVAYEFPIQPEKTTVIGYPEPIKLPRR